MTEETALSTEIASPTLSDLAMGNPNPLFMSHHGERLKKVVKPTMEDLLGIVTGLPDDLKDKVTELLKTMSPNRPGLYLSEDRPVFTELRVFQGTGNDRNRPENALVGEFYLTTKTNAGKEFVGTVLAIWQGHTMWPDQQDEVRAPTCTSMDRRVGSKYGNCSSCPHRPWRGGKRQACGTDVVVFMLPQDLSDIVMVRFQRTSAKSGEQLVSLARKDLVPWQRWFKLTTEKQTGSGDRRWYVINVNPVEGDHVPPKLTPFCAALEQMASHDFILPGIAHIYRSAAESDDDNDDDDAGESETATKESGEEPSNDKYGDFNM